MTYKFSWLRLFLHSQQSLPTTKSCLYSQIFQDGVHRKQTDIISSRRRQKSSVIAIHLLLKVQPVDSDEQISNQLWNQMTKHTVQPSQRSWQRSLTFCKRTQRSVGCNCLTKSEHITNKLKQKKTANQYPHYDLEHIASIFKETIRKEVLNRIDREPEELWNEIKVVVKDKCEERLPRRRSRKANKLDVTTIENNLENCQEEKTSQSQEKQRFQEGT